MVRPEYLLGYLNFRNYDSRGRSGGTPVDADREALMGTICLHPQISVEAPDVPPGLLEWKDTNGSSAE